MRRLHPKTVDLLREMGGHIRTWRRIQRLTATVVADRAGISRTTLRSIEANPGGATFDNVMAVLAVLGLDEDVANSVDPTRSMRGRALLTTAARREA